MDPDTRTATVVIEVDCPWASFRSGEHPALQPGMFCRVDITADAISNAFVIPRAALHHGNAVHLVEDGSLARRQVQVARIRHDEAVIGAGLQAGDQLVASVLSAPVAGVKLRPLEAGPQATNKGRASERLSSGGRN